MGWWSSLFGRDLGAGGTPRGYQAATKKQGRAPDWPNDRVLPYHLATDLRTLRARSKWMIRNNPYAAALARDLASQIVGSGILPGSDERLWEQWRDDPKLCDELERMGLVGLQWQAARAVIATGEAFIVRRIKRPDSVFPLPMRVLVLDGDSIDYGLHSGYSHTGTRLAHGIEYSARGKRIGYYFRIPQYGRGGSMWSEGDRIRISAEDVIHLYDPAEPGMERGVPWLAPALLTLGDLNEYQGSSIKKAEIAAKLAVVTSSVAGMEDGMLPDEDEDEGLRPGYELPVTPGSQVTPFPQTAADGIDVFSKVAIQQVAAAAGTSFEALTGDYRGMPFSSARMSRLTQERRISGWRSRWMMPAARRIWAWARDAALIRGEHWPEAHEIEWPEPRHEAVEPDKEGRAAQQQIRSGLTSLSDELRKRGKVPRRHLEQMAEDLKLIDELGLTLDTDPRILTAQGQAQHAAPGAEPEPKADPDDDDDDRGTGKDGDDDDE